MSILLETEKTFDKIQYSFMKKINKKQNSHKTRNRREFPHLMKNIYQKLF